MSTIALDKITDCKKMLLLVCDKYKILVTIPQLTCGQALQLDAVWSPQLTFLPGWKSKKEGLNRKSEKDWKGKVRGLKKESEKD